MDFAAELIRIPTVNPPGENYPECAELLGARLGAWSMDVEHVTRSEEAHQPDESCSIDDLVASAKVMALVVLQLVG